MQKNKNALNETDVILILQLINKKNNRVTGMRYEGIKISALYFSLLLHLALENTEEVITTLYPLIHDPHNTPVLLAALHTAWSNIGNCTRC